MHIRTLSQVPLTGLMLASNAAAETLKVATWNIENFTVGSRRPQELAALHDPAYGQL